MKYKSNMSIFTFHFIFARKLSFSAAKIHCTCCAVKSCQITFSISGVVCCWSRSLNGSPGDLWPVDPFSSKVSSSFSRKICWKRPRKSVLPTLENQIWPNDLKSVANMANFCLKYGHNMATFSTNFDPIFSFYCIFMWQFFFKLSKFELTFSKENICI